MKIKGDTVLPRGSVWVIAVSFHLAHLTRDFSCFSNTGIATLNYLFVFHTQEPILPRPNKARFCYVELYCIFRSCVFSKLKVLLCNPKVLRFSSEIN